jgi:hypothetical protein
MNPVLPECYGPYIYAHRVVEKGVWSFEKVLAGSLTAIRLPIELATSLKEKTKAVLACALIA